MSSIASHHAGRVSLQMTLRDDSVSATGDHAGSARVLHQQASLKAFETQEHGMLRPHWLAIDVGNSRIKLALFEARAEASGAALLPTCWAGWTVALGETPPWRQILEAIANRSRPLMSVIAGSNQAGVDSVVRAWPSALGRPPCIVRSSENFPLKIAVDEPRRVGLDRVLNAVAAATVTGRKTPAVIVDCGTATTVDLVDSDGTFLGGAILPGFALSAQALHHYTEVLPLVAIEDIVQVDTAAGGHPALGKNTRAAIMSGIFWGQVGAVRELVHRLRMSAQGEAQLILAGGGSRLLIPHLADATHYPYLALQGLVLVAASGRATCAEVL